MLLPSAGLDHCRSLRLQTCCCVLVFALFLCEFMRYHVVAGWLVQWMNAIVEEMWPKIDKAVCDMVKVRSKGIMWLICGGACCVLHASDKS